MAGASPLPRKGGQLGCGTGRGYPSDGEPERPRTDPDLPVAGALSASPIAICRLYSTVPPIIARPTNEATPKLAGPLPVPPPASAGGRPTSKVAAAACRGHWQAARPRGAQGRPARGLTAPGHASGHRHVPASFSLVRHARASGAFRLLRAQSQKHAPQGNLAPAVADTRRGNWKGKWLPSHQQCRLPHGQITPAEPRRRPAASRQGRVCR